MARKPKTNYSKLTEELLERFLEILSNNGGIVVDACRDVNVSRTAIYIKRRDDPEFREAMIEAIDRGIDVIEDEAKRRALDGTEEPIYYQGELVGHVYKKSDYCLGIVLKAHRPQYRVSQHEVSGPGGSPLSSSIEVVVPDNGRRTAKRRAKK